MHATVAVFGYLRFPPESVSAVMPYLKQFVEATRDRDGCLAYDVAEDVFDPGLLRFSELWPDNERLDAHLCAPHIGPWREAAKRHGLLERVFVAYDLNGSRPV